MKLLSVIISTYNRADLLDKAIEGILSQESDGSFDYEVMIIDNNSSDNTRSIVEGYIPKSERRLRYIFQPIQGKSASLNLAISRAKGDILAFTDDDAVISTSWLLELNRCFDEHDCDGVGGRVLPDYPLDTPQWIRDNAVQLAGAIVIYDYGEGIRQLDKAMYPFIGCNYAFRKEMFEQCGKYRLDLGPGTNALGEDTEFVDRLLYKGKKLYYCGKALVWHSFDPKRMHWLALAQWHEAVGRFDAEREKYLGESFAYYFGVPRYLFKKLFLSFGRVIMHCLNRKKRWDAYRSFFRTIGMIKQYRSSHIDQLKAKKGLI